MAVDVAFDGADGLERALVTDYDVIVLDRDLPGRHGDEVCAELVRAGGRSRVLMLTAAATIEDRVDGLGLGADDYLPKPFAFAELVARLRALLRRAQPPLAPGLERGDLRLVPAAGRRDRRDRAAVPARTAAASTATSAVRVAVPRAAADGAAAADRAVRRLVPGFGRVPAGHHVLPGGPAAAGNAFGAVYYGRRNRGR